MGTVFNVVHDGLRTDVAVSEGAVRWQRAGARVDLTAGMALSQRGAERPAVTRTALATVGGWRAGQLSYSGARYDAVAADLARNLGARVAIDDTAAARRFSGVIAIDADAPATMSRAGALLDLRVRRAGNDWVLAAE
jgi:transmembrane sensor